MITIAIDTLPSSSGDGKKPTWSSKESRKRDSADLENFLERLSNSPLLQRRNPDVEGRSFTLQETAASEP
jgi:hypothetical protein